MAAGPIERRKQTGTHLPELAKQRLTILSVPVVVVAPARSLRARVPAPEAPRIHRDGCEGFGRGSYDVGGWKVSASCFGCFLSSVAHRHIGNMSRVAEAIERDAQARLRRVLLGPEWDKRHLVQVRRGRRAIRRGIPKSYGNCAGESGRPGVTDVAIPTALLPKFDTVETAITSYREPDHENAGDFGVIHRNEVEPLRLAPARTKRTIQNRTLVVSERVEHGISISGIQRRAGSLEVAAIILTRPTAHDIQNILILGSDVIL